MAYDWSEAREKSLSDYWEDSTQGIKKGFDDTFGSGTDFNDSLEYLNNANIAWQLPKGIIEGKSVKGIFKKWADDVIHPSTSSGKVLRTLGILVAAYATGGAALNALGGKAAVSSSIGAMSTASTPAAAMAAAPSTAAVTAASTSLSASAKGALALTAASTVVSGAMSYNATKRAESLQREGTDAAIGAQRESDDKYYAQVEQRRQDLSPYVQAGYEAMGYTPQEARDQVGGGQGQYGGTDGGMQNNPQGTQPSVTSGGSPMPRGGKGPTAPGTTPLFSQNGAPINSGGIPAQYDETGMPIPRTGGNPTTRSFESGYSVARPALDSFVEGGMNAYSMQQDLAGLNGPDAQQAAYDVVESDPAYQYQIQKAEEGIMQNATATGGIRGGNIQGALAEFRPAFLSNAINQKYNQLAPISAMGGNVAQNMYGTAQTSLENTANRGLSAAGGTPIGQAGSSPTANLLQQSGMNSAGYSMANNNNMTNLINSGIENYFTARKMGMFENNTQDVNPYVNYSGPDYSQPSNNWDYTKYGDQF